MMRKTTKTNLFVWCFVALLIVLSKADAAETPYFQGKTIILQVGAPAGG